MAGFDLESEHLSLRPIDAEDVDALHAIWIDEQVRRFLWDGDNLQSIHLLANLGMTIVKREAVEGLDTVFYRLPRRATGWTPANQLTR